MYDLLTDPLIGVHTPEGLQCVTLPELLAGLSAGKIEGYTGLRAHQADPWHVFLVQLAASIQARHPTTSLPTDPGYWRDGLLHLAEGKQSAWHLIWEEVTQPAFLQHPWESWQAEAKDYGVEIKRGQVSYDPKANSPDELDVLVTSKNHDVKIARMGAEAIEAWLFALVLLQTTSGFLGQGNYGIVRMNGGYASRAIVSWTSSLHPSARFQEEVGILKAMRPDVVRAYRYANDGVVLTWLSRWNRAEHQYLLSRLDPWFIEAARPVRLVALDQDRLIALGATSKARQIGPKTVENGDVGDPWTPLNVQDKKKGRSALTLPAEGFTPERLTALLFAQGYELTALQQPRPGEEHAWFVASCLVRGQGTTDGFHQALIPVPPKARLALINKQSRETLGHLAQQLLADAKTVQQILDTALTLLSEGGPEKADFERVKAWLANSRRDFSRHWEAQFFPTLWRGADAPHEAVRQEWRQYLVDGAQALLDDAIERLPLPANRTWRAITQAQGIFDALLRKNELPKPHRRSIESHTPEEATS